MSIEKSSIKLTCWITVICMVCMSLIVLSDFSLSGFLTAVILLRVICLEILGREEDRARKQLLKQLDEFICDIRHYYHNEKSVIEAVWEAKECAGRIMRLNGEQIYSVLTAEDTKYARELYMEGCSERHLRLLLTLLLKVSEEGENFSENVSVFLTNLTDLRRDIQEEIRFCKRREYYFSGFKLTTVLPILAIPYISRWGISTAPEMNSFYNAGAGFIVRMAALILAWMNYSGIVKLRDGIRVVGESENALIRWLSDTNVIIWLTDLLLSVNKRRTHLIIMRLNYLNMNYTARAFCVKQLLYAIGSVAAGILLSVYSGNHTASPLWVILSVAAGIIAYFIPYLLLYLNSELSENIRQEEVLRFHTIIMLFSASPGTDNMLLLETMEEFSLVYRKSIEECINEYSADSIMALENLKNREKYAPFRHIADCLINAEDTGVTAAFEEIVSDTRNFRENNALERTIALRDRSRLAMLLSILPGMLILFGYLLIPFILNALKMFDSYTEQLEGML